MTTHRLAKGAALLSILAPSAAWCLGLGDIKVDTALNQPLRAEIRLLSVGPDEIDNVRVSLASQESFDRVGIERPFALSQLEFKPSQGETGGAFIAVTTKQPVREPFLNFLVEVQWPNGRLLREYTVLLDPPVLMDQRAGAVVKAPAVFPEARAAPAVARERATPAQESVRQPGRSAPQSETVAGDARAEDVVSSPSGGEADSSASHSVVTGDTLGEIAQLYRPDDEVTLSRMMMAILRANPEAFSRNNINNLKSGVILRIPASDEIAAVGEREAAAEVARQNSLWREYRDQIADAVLPEQIDESLAASQSAEGSAEQPVPITGEDLAMSEGSASRQSTARDSTASNTDGRLKIMASDQSSENAEAADAGGNNEPMDVQSDAPLARELAESRRVEIESLQAKVADLESMIAKQERIISLQSEALAGLHDRLEPGVTQAPGEAVVQTEAEAAASEETAPEVTGTDDASAGLAGMEPSAVSQPVAESEATAQEDQSEAVAPSPSPSLMEDLFASSSMLVGVGVGAALLLGLIWLVVRGAASKRLEKIDLATYEADSGDVMDAQTPSTDGKAQQAIGDPKVVTQKVAAIGAPGETQSAGAVDTQATSDQATVQQEGGANDETLAEADVYIAYGLHQQAEELLREAVKRNSSRSDYRLKLLEVYYAGKNQAGFDVQAQALLDSSGGKPGAIWDRVVTMGKDISANNPLFNAAGSVGSSAVGMQARESAPAPSETAYSGRLSGMGTEDALAVDLESGELTDGLGEATQIAAAAIADDNAILDFDASDLDATAIAKPLPEPSSATLQLDEGALDFDLSDLELADDGSATVDGKPTVASSSWESFDPHAQNVMLPGDSRTRTTPSAQSAGGEYLDTSVDRSQAASQRTALLDETVLKLDDDSRSDDLEALVGDDEIGTKLDLAKAYMDMGDADGALSTLEEVMQEGDDDQRKEAEVLMQQIA